MAIMLPLWLDNALLADSDRPESEQPVFVKTGTAVFRFGRVLPVYEATFFLGKGVETSAVLEKDIPMRLEIRYLRALSRDRLVEAGDSIVRRVTPPEVLAEVWSRIEKINSLYQDVQAGDRYSLTYLPSIGTTLALNDQIVGQIEGYDFARAYFAIWLGEHTAKRSLRNQLLPSIAARP